MPKRIDESWIVPVVGGIIVVVIIACILLPSTPKPEPKPFVLPDAEKMGQKAGSATAGFGKGFFRGEMDRLKSGDEKTDEK